MTDLDTIKLVEDGERALLARRAAAALGRRDNAKWWPGLLHALAPPSVIHHRTPVSVGAVWAVQEAAQVHSHRTLGCDCATPSLTAASALGTPVILAAAEADSETT